MQASSHSPYPVFLGFEYFSDTPLPLKPKDIQLIAQSAIAAFIGHREAARQGKPKEHYPYAAVPVLSAQHKFSYDVSDPAKPLGYLASVDIYAETATLDTSGGAIVKIRAQKTEQF